MLWETRSNPGNDSDPVAGLRETTEELVTARKALEAVEAEALAGAVEVLVGVVGRAVETVERLEATRPAEWMKAHEAAAHLRLDRADFNRLAAAGDIPRHNFGERTFRYHRGELDAWGLSHLEDR